jgi:hypothetical protein
MTPGKGSCRCLPDPAGQMKEPPWAWRLKGSSRSTERSTKEVRVFIVSPCSDAAPALDRRRVEHRTSVRMSGV